MSEVCHSDNESTLLLLKLRVQLLSFVRDQLKKVLQTVFRTITEYTCIFLLYFFMPKHFC